MVHGHDVDAGDRLDHRLVERYLERDLRPKLRRPASDLLLTDDLGIDSLTMMEIVMLAEEVLQITITSEELVRVALKQGAR